MKIENKNGPKQHPCGTPQGTPLLSEKLLLKNTHCVVSERQFFIQARAKGEQL